MSRPVESAPAERTASLKVLIELRPALAGHAGIPQETRLLFNGLAHLSDVQVHGLIQSSNRVLDPGLPAQPSRWRRKTSPDQQINRLSRVVVSMQEPGRRAFFEKVRNRLKTVSSPFVLALSSVLGIAQRLSVFEPAHFRDFVWRTLFAKTLAAEDFERVTGAGFLVARLPYAAMHACGLLTRKLGWVCYPRLDTRGIDVFIGQTPYPATVAKSTRLVIRYFDAVPLLMPHTIVDKSFHQALHYGALRKNVASGAWFACCSDATRRDLLAVFPEAESTAVTIPCMLSHHFYREESSHTRVAEILSKRFNERVGVTPVAGPAARPLGTEADALARPPIDYLLVVSTIEPRKNHETVLAAWEQLRAEKYPDLRLVCVGGLGWDHEPIVRQFLPWIERGEAFLLADVPPDELRLLYAHARATVCPSYAEGFGYSGVEAMRCGGAVAASDLPVHREIYADAAEYFGPYSVAEAIVAIDRIIDPRQMTRRQELIAAGAEVSARYLPDRILPLWAKFLRDSVVKQGAVG